MTMVWLGRNSMNLLVRSHSGASCNGRNSMTLLVRAHGGASCNGRNSMTLWWELMVVPQVMDVIPWPSSESSWWCLK